ncbi:Hypothetical_protein [Hexamita inflata]|uniref:Hypothetical_protein n=1 Tax=Hexamita inflata TaxID=28002 RepID=A0AA86TSP3_9EUKA|nr:Hypothetical protein HINF_LOCUS14851 [Hexamita inflata]
MNNNSFLVKDNHDSRQQQHRICTQYIMGNNKLITEVDIKISDSEESELITQLQVTRFEDLLPQKQFQTKMFKQLISSAQSVSCSQSFSKNDSFQIRGAKTMECLFTMDDESSSNNPGHIIKIKSLIDLQ